MKFYAKYLAIKRYWPTPKLLLVMKLTVLWMFLALTQVSANSFAQRISLNEKNTPLAKVLTSIKKQSGYFFVYDNKEVGQIKVSVQLSQVSLEQALEASLKNQSLTYKIVDKTVMIKKANPAVMDRVMDFFSDVGVRGKVLDERGEPLQGATVKVKDGTLSTTTDKNGEFYLRSVPDNAVIVIAYLGYKPLEMKATPSLGIIKMELETSKLEEVTISTGYWNTTKQLSTGNITKISAEEIQRQPVTSPLMALQGRVAGLDIAPNNGAPGGAAKIRIRGENSLSVKKGVGGGLPLYVVDGVVIDSRPLASTALVFYNFENNGGIDPLSTINPENIESIEILKDADATAVYGSRGANGVILITTKKARPQKGSIEASMYKGVGQVAQRLELLNTQQYLEMRREAFKNDLLSPSATDYDVNGAWDENRYTDWQDVLFGGKAQITDAQFNYSSGAASTTFRLGGAYHKEGTVFPGDFGQTRVTGNFNLNHFSKDQKFSMVFSGNYGVTRHNLFSANLIHIAQRLAPHAPMLYDGNGNLNWQIIDQNGTPKNTFENPLAELLKTYAATTHSLVTSGTVSYKIVPQFTIKANLGYTRIAGDELVKSPIAAQSPTEANFTSAYSSAGINARSSWVLEPQLNYTNNFGQHALNAMVGASVQENSAMRREESASGYASDALLNSLEGATTAKVIEDRRSMYRYSGLFGRLGYGYKEKYLLNISGRRDGSSRFGPGNQFGNFAAIGTGWLFSKEHFIAQKIPFLSFGKIRASYGTTGSDQIGDYQFYNLYRIGSLNYYGQVTLEPSALYNSDFKWELTRKLEAGLDLGFFNNRVSIEAAWYRNRSSNQLIFFQLPAVTGFESVLRNFDATVENSGWELLLNTQNVVTKKLLWSSSFNITLPSNKLVKFPGIEESAYNTLYKIGEPLSIQRLYQYEGVDPATGVHKIKDLNGDGVYNNDDRIFMFPTDRKLYGGLLNTFRIGGLELSALFQFSNQYLREGPIILPGERNFNQPPDVLGRWQQPGDVTGIAKYSTTPAAISWYNQYVRQSDYGIIDAWFVRLKTVSLAYSLPSKWIGSAKLQSVNLFIQAQNLVTLTNYNRLDPDGGGGGLPQLRMITGGIQLKL